MEHLIRIASEEDLAAAYDRVEALKTAPGWSADDPEYRALLEAVLAWRMRRPTTQHVPTVQDATSPVGQPGRRVG